MIADNLHILMFVAAFFALLAGYHVALTLGGVALMFAGIGIAFDVFEPRALIFWPGRILGNMSNQVLAAVPLFVLMGVILEKSRVAEDLLEAAGRMLGGVRGGLGYSVVLVGALLAASTGIVGATVVTMTLIALPSMLSQGYDKRISSGVIAASGTLGQIIPPSIVLIVLADAISNANAQARQESGLPPSPVSAGDLFAGALIPGLILVGLYLGYIALMSILKPDLMPARKAAAPGAHVPSIGQTVFAFGAPLMLILAVLGSILGGFTSPTEAASVGAIGATLLAGARTRMDADKRGWTYSASLIGAGALLFLLALVWMLKLGLIGGLAADAPPSAFFTGTFFGQASTLIVSVLVPFGLIGALTAIAQAGHLNSSLKGAAEITAMVFLILICASLFSIVFRELGGDEFVEHLLNSAPGGMWGALAFTMLAVFLLGFFLDFLEIVFIVTPLIAPPLISMGADPVWLGVLLAINLQTSFLTPPFGFALFYLKGAAPPEVQTPDIWRGAAPFILLQVIGLGLVIAFPGLTGR